MKYKWRQTFLLSFSYGFRKAGGNLVIFNFKILKQISFYFPSPPWLALPYSSSLSTFVSSSFFIPGKQFLPFELVPFLFVFVHIFLLLLILFRWWERIMCYELVSFGIWKTCYVKERMKIGSEYSDGESLL